MKGKVKNRKTKSEKTNKEINLKNKNGITLIALVITIIVLLILAAVSIATLTGENGILTRANDAKEQTEIASVKEQAKLDIVNWTAERLKNGEDATLNDATVKNILETANADNENPYYKELQTDKIITPSGYEILYSELYTKTEVGNDNIKEYTEDGVPIPNGFYYVGGTKDTGVIISDDPDDPNVEIADKTSHEAATMMRGNQFVWVPVDTFGEFEREHFGTESQKWWSGTFVTDGLSANNMYEPKSDGTKDGTEVEKMYKSVKTYHGFYVGRYEAGVEGTRTSGISDDVVIKQGKNVYNNIKWGNSMADETGGAVQLAREFSEKSKYVSVTSTLIYGVQWDAIMRWMKEEENTEGGKYVQDSTGRGYYNQFSPTTTGSNSNYAVKNIYDLAGNVYEWTMESYGVNGRVDRGGRYDLSGSYAPSSGRSYGDPSVSYPVDGFRVTLYL